MTILSPFGRLVLPDVQEGPAQGPGQGQQPQQSTPNPLEGETAPGSDRSVSETNSMVNRMWTRLGGTLACACIAAATAAQTQFKTLRESSTVVDYATFTNRVVQLESSVSATSNSLSASVRAMGGKLASVSNSLATSMDSKVEEMRRTIESEVQMLGSGVDPSVLDSLVTNRINATMLSSTSNIVSAIVTNRTQVPTGRWSLKWNGRQPPWPRFGAPPNATEIELAGDPSFHEEFFAGDGGWDVPVLVKTRGEWNEYVGAYDYEYNDLSVFVVILVRAPESAVTLDLCDPQNVMWNTNAPADIGAGWTAGPGTEPGPSPLGIVFSDELDGAVRQASDDAAALFRNVPAVVTNVVYVTNLVLVVGGMRLDVGGVVSNIVNGAYVNRLVEERDPQVSMTNWTLTVHGVEYMFPPFVKEKVAEAIEELGLVLMDFTNGTYVIRGDFVNGLGSRIDKGEPATSNIIYSAHAEGVDTVVVGENVRGAHAEGVGSKAGALGAHAEGFQTQALGEFSHTEGYMTQATAPNARALGWMCKAFGHSSIAAGDSSIAGGTGSLAFGWNCTASNDMAIALGSGAKATHRSSFVWSGGQSGSTGSHGDGTFNIYTQHPTGQWGVYINGADLQVMIEQLVDNKISQALGSSAGEK